MTADDMHILSIFTGSTKFIAYFLVYLFLLLLVLFITYFISSFAHYSNYIWITSYSHGYRILSLSLLIIANRFSPHSLINSRFSPKPTQIQSDWKKKN